jgi:hypothetical protein
MADPAELFVGKEYQSFEGRRRWELGIDDIILVILETGIKRSQDHNLVGIAADTLRVKWVFTGVGGGPDAYDGVTGVSIRDGHVWVQTWAGVAHRIDHRTGKILQQVITK